MGHAHNSKWTGIDCRDAVLRGAGLGGPLEGGAGYWCWAAACPFKLRSTEQLLQTQTD